MVGTLVSLSIGVFIGLVIWGVEHLGGIRRGTEKIAAENHRIAEILEALAKEVAEK